MSLETKRSDTTPERYVHIKLNHPKFSHATLFARKEGEDWRYAIAFCLRGDQFSRRVGRSVARRKYMKSNPIFQPILDWSGDPKMFYDVCEYTIQYELKGMH